MTPRQARFVAEYLVDLNATQAAIRAGYSAKTAVMQGSRLLTNDEIAGAVEKGKGRQLEASGLTAEKVLEAIRRPLEADVRALFDEKGNVRPIHTLSAEEASLIAGYEVIIKNAKAGDGHQDEVLKVRLADRSRYVEMAAKHFKLLTEKHELTLTLNIGERIRTAKARTTWPLLPA